MKFIRTILDIIVVLIGAGLLFFGVVYGALGDIITGLVVGAVGIIVLIVHKKNKQHRELLQAIRENKPTGPVYGDVVRAPAPAANPQQKPVYQRPCPKCGIIVKGATNFCPKCGYKFQIPVPKEYL